MCSSPDGAARVRALYCVLKQVPLSTQVYKFNAGENPAVDSMIPSRDEIEIFLVASCYTNRDKRRPDGPVGSYVDLTFHVAQCK